MKMQTVLIPLEDLQKFYADTFLELKPDNSNLKDIIETLVTIRLVQRLGKVGEIEW